jgi:hypothetical protein
MTTVDRGRCLSGLRTAPSGRRVSQTPASSLKSFWGLGTAGKQALTEQLQAVANSNLSKASFRGRAVLLQVRCLSFGHRSSADTSVVFLVSSDATYYCHPRLRHQKDCSIPNCLIYCCKAHYFYRHLMRSSISFA